MPNKSLGLFPASLSTDPLFCLEFVEITNNIETCLVAVAVTEARPPQDEYETDSTQEMTFLIGGTKILSLLPFQDVGGQRVPIFSLICKARL